MPKNARFLFLAAVILGLGAVSANAQVVMQNCSIPDIGQTNIFANPVVIYWNPCVAAQVERVSPGASVFFMAHEQCHAMMRSADEAQADACGARMAGPAAAQAAIRYFAVAGIPCTPSHGCAVDRIRVIAGAAGLPLS